MAMNAGVTYIESVKTGKDGTCLLEDEAGMWLVALLFFFVKMKVCRNGSIRAHC